MEYFHKTYSYKNYNIPFLIRLLSVHDLYQLHKFQRKLKTIGAIELGEDVFHFGTLRSEKQEHPKHGTAEINNTLFEEYSKNNVTIGIIVFKKYPYVQCIVYISK